MKGIPAKYHKRCGVVNWLSVSYDIIDIHHKMLASDPCRYKDIVRPSTILIQCKPGGHCLTIETNDHKSKIQNKAPLLDKG